MDPYQLHNSAELSFPVSLLPWDRSATVPSCPGLGVFLSSDSSFLVQWDREALPAQPVGCVLPWDAEQLSENWPAGISMGRCAPASTLLAQLCSP